MARTRLGKLVLIRVIANGGRQRFLGKTDYKDKKESRDTVVFNIYART